MLNRRLKGSNDVSTTDLLNKNNIFSKFRKILQKNGIRLTKSQRRLNIVSKSYKTQAASPLGHRSAIAGALLQYPDIIYWQGTEKFCMLATLAHLEHLFVRFI